MTDTITIATKCPICHQPHDVEGVDFGQYMRWKRGELLIQDALPDVPPELRELLQTGIDDPCFKRLFAEEDER